jgi:hypothetical protein
VSLVPVVCDDGSGDATAEVAEREGARVLRHPENRGLAEALPTLFTWALTHGKPGDLFLTMDMAKSLISGKLPRFQAEATPTARRGEMGHPVEESLVP